MLTTNALALALAAATVATSQVPSRSADLRVGADTVRFLEGLVGYGPVDTVSAAYAYVRSSGDWLRLGQVRRPPSADQLFAVGKRDTVWLGEDVALLRRPYQAGRPTFVVWSPAWDTTYPVRPEIDMEDWRRLAEAATASRRPLTDEQVRSYPISQGVAAWTRQGNDLWLGLYGGFPEGQGALGGLLRFDLQDRELEELWYEGLADHVVSGLAVAGGALWIGTYRPIELKLTGETGLLRYDLQDGSWRSFTRANSRLPSNVIYGLASDGQRVWLSTQCGLAMLDVATESWEVRFYELVVRGEDLIHILSPDPPAPGSPAESGMIWLIGYLGIERAGSFLEVARGLPADRFAHVPVASDEELLEILTQPALAPFLIEALPPGPGTAWEALENLGFERWYADLAAHVDTVSYSKATDLARELMRRADSLGYRLLKRVLADPPEDRRSVHRTLTAAEQLRPEDRVPVLLWALRVSEFVNPEYYDRLMRIGTPAAYRGLARIVSENQGYRSRFLEDMVDRFSDWSAVEDDSLRTAVVRRAEETLEGEASTEVRFHASLIAVESRARPALAPLIPGLREDSYYERVLRALIRATGEVPELPPAPATDIERRRAAARFWDEWWAVHGEAFRFVPREEGEAAYRDWVEERG